MRNLLCLSLVCALLAPAFAGEKSAEKPSVSQKIEGLAKSAAKGCKTSAETLARLQKSVDAKDLADLQAKVAMCEKYGPMGCSVSQKVLATLGAEMGKKTPAAKVALSARLAKMNKGCAAGCEKSKAAMAALVKEYKVENGDALVKLVQTWETKAADGCQSCVGKLAALDAKLPAAKPALSVRVARMAKGCANGCEKSKAKMATLLEETGTETPEALVKQIQTWESKASNGCQKCVGKLASLEAKLPGAAVAKTAKAPSLDGSECTDCDGCDCSCSGGCPLDKPSKS